jgi:hypothetical protein
MPDHFTVKDKHRSLVRPNRVSYRAQNRPLNGKEVAIPLMVSPSQWNNGVTDYNPILHAPVLQQSILPTYLCEFEKPKDRFFARLVCEIFLSSPHAVFQQLGKVLKPRNLSIESRIGNRWRAERRKVRQVAGPRPVVPSESEGSKKDFSLWSKRRSRLFALLGLPRLRSGHALAQ